MIPIGYQQTDSLDIIDYRNLVINPDNKENIPKSHNDNGTIEITLKNIRKRWIKLPQKRDLFHLDSTLNVIKRSSTKYGSEI